MPRKSIFKEMLREHDLNDLQKFGYSFTIIGKIGVIAPSFFYFNSLAAEHSHHSLSVQPKKGEVSRGETAKLEQAIHQLTEQHAQRLRPLTEELLRRLPRLQTILLKVQPTRRATRTAGYVHLAGVPSLQTEYKEYQTVMFVDLATTFFSPAMNHERKRIALHLQGIRKGYLLNAFAGNGAYSLVIARHSKGWHHVAIDLNANALQLFKEAIQANHFTDSFHLIRGDATRLIPAFHLKRRFNVVLLPHPLVARIVLPSLSRLLSETALVFYQTTWNSFKPASQVPSEAEIQLRPHFHHLNYQIQHVRIIRTLAPRVYHLAVDLQYKA